MNAGLPFALNIALGVGLLALLGLSGLGVGLRLMRRLQGETLPTLDQALIGVALGLGVAAYGVVILGLVGGLTRTAILAWLGVLALLGVPVGGHFVRQALPGWCRAWAEEWARLAQHRLRWVPVLLGVSGLLAFLTALTPPWDYDGLMYHLEGPRQFLAAGRLILLPEVWQANGPSNGEMLFLFGLSLGSDIFPKLVHGLFGALWVGVGLRLGRLWGGPRTGWLAAAVLGSLPYLPLLAGWAYIDLIWFTWEGLAFYVLGRWGQSTARPPSWVVLSGLLLGLALGTKYTALAALPVAGVLLLALAWREGWRAGVGLGLRLVLPALGLAAPWYLKNLALGGNPFYPLFWGGVGYPRARWELLATYLYDFGLERTPLNLLRLPLALYLQRERFVTFMGTADVPPLLLPLVLLAPLKRRWGRREALWLGVVLLRGLAWAVGTQQTRFLYPVFLGLSPLAAEGLEVLLDGRRRRLGWAVGLGLVAGCLTATLAIQGTTLGRLLQPTRLWLGQESPTEWLVRPWPDFALQAALPADAKVLLLWEGRGYYCAPRCLADADHTRGVRLAEAAGGDVMALARALAAQGVTHLLLDRESALFSLYHDPSGHQRQALDFWEQVFLPRCAEMVQAGEWARLYRLTCLGE
ncbi:hypothetical protein [uncultured Thermanaerothrix sp.]|uniref:ArnT family glycosyltransferase n=1 Tax=uncultured Thermanaerothrix sp. TaxID=1195149 RepID=UPI00260723B4|nr:hypothetical protein [uncultured Thermanaerothrix sp.]